MAEAVPVDSFERVAWTSAKWLNAPQSVQLEGEVMVVETAENSDHWRTTATGFIHDTGHALLSDFPVGCGMEVEFEGEWEAMFDQAGLFLYADDSHWVKAGVEFADGALQLGAVVTSELSDWSVGPVPSWHHARIRIRASRGEGAVTIRARMETGKDEKTPWQLVRLAPLDDSLVWRAGPMAASPTRRSLMVKFHDWRRTKADSCVHEA
eukprot:TRINITY_DN81795_c0_g1_i1.p1 TRINITY_DN81795_c0_g1~~TRINITY_DN81795_c0_g1_i1.p1  ORF type:complete len:209 (+),score=53.79 TRINITY_DN81795_c0_g1_i1:77-703(+)